ncbi:uncharacterized protein N7459_006527 [Penicillium hispanicum]|uniref:uncharacterized protein n=1 Tax=Penicillium hispanicum TaxID=1080232 RepID=UPI00253F9DAC|nr:uncharacterized protein N7459_006527 [Penicillium hispanicum]KAJ5577563.1 hypothetical protein N7459_006527 [Penicillium hispanicum]
MAEVMPMQIRGTGNAFAVGIGNWAFSTLWNQVSPIALGKLQWRFYFVFVAWNLCISLPVIYFFFPETKLKTLEEIDLLFEEQPRLNIAEREDAGIGPFESEKETGVSATNVEDAGMQC